MNAFSRQPASTINSLKGSSMNIYGKNIQLVSVTHDDAEFILSLRSDTNLNRYLSKVEVDIEKQVQWITDYLKRETQRTEYYFVIADKGGEKLGTVRIYDFQFDSFSWGSWIIKPGSPSCSAIESALCVYEYAFNTLGFKKCHFEVRKVNHKVIAFHSRFGAQIVREDDQNYYFELLQSDYLCSKKRYLKYLPETE